MNSKLLEINYAALERAIAAYIKQLEYYHMKALESIAIPREYFETKKQTIW